MKKIVLILMFVTVAARADWVNVLDNIPIVNALTATGNYVFAGTNITFQGGGVYRTTNNGNSWEQVHFSTTLSLASNANFIYRGYQNGFSYSSNYGSNWATPGGASRWITALLADENYVYNGCFTPAASTNRGVWISSNNGANWSQTSLNDKNIYALTKSGNYSFAGGNGIYVSTDNGTNWSLSSGTLGPWALASNGNNIYSGNNGVYVSTNNGGNWTQTLSNNVSVHSLVVYNNNVFAGGGFWVSTDNGETWTERIEGMGNLSVNTLCISNGYVFAGTSFGIWRRPLSELVGIQTISNEIPNHFSLSQNYPNPFNPTTNFEFKIVKSGFVNLTIYDAMGREVETLVNGQLRPGTYKADWYASKYPSGVYFYRMVTSDYSQTRKMVLTK
jgi:hypothetical protein